MFHQVIEPILAMVGVAAIIWWIVLWVKSGMEDNED